MNAAILLGLVAALVATSYLSALNLALVGGSRSALERRLLERNLLPRRGWILENLHAASHAVALFRTFGRVACFALILLAFIGVGEEARVTWAALGLTVLTSVVLVWLLTSVVSAAVARYVGDGLIASSVPFIRVACTIARPLLALVGLVDEAVRRLAGVAEHDPDEAEEDLLLTIEDSRREGELDPLSASILENVVEFRSTAVSSVMTPRMDIVGLAYTDDLDRIRLFLAEAGHSRVPVFEESLDAIIGVLYTKDLVRYVGTTAPEFRLRPLLREPIRVPESKPVRELLVDFQRSEVHLAIVVDEYGGTAGLATIEDVLEEIVGEINDEHDADGDIAPELKPVGEGRWELPGRHRVDDLNAALDIEVPEDEDYDTVAGFLLKAMGRIPRAGDVHLHDGLRFEIAAATPTAITTIVLTVPQPAHAAPAERDEAIRRPDEEA